MALGYQQGPGTVCACWLFEVGVLNSVAHSLTKFLNLCPFKSRVTEQLFPLDCEDKSRHCRWSQEVVASRLFILELVFFMVGGMAYNEWEGEQLAWQVGVFEDHHAVHEVSKSLPILQWVHTIPWAPRIWRTSQLLLVNSHTTVYSIDGIIYGYFIQKNAMAHIVNFSVAVLSEVFGGQSLTRGLSPLYVQIWFCAIIIWRDM